MNYEHVPMYQLLSLWKAAAKTPKGVARNTLYWEIVNELRRRGYAGNARRVVERTAAW